MFYPPPEELRVFLESNSDLYFPIRGGNSLEQDQWCVDHAESDAGSDNISGLNPLLNEMTSIYWFWKNKQLPDYVGFNHYRRFFPRESISDYADYDIIISKPIFSSSIPLVAQYQFYHRIMDLDKCVQYFIETVPEWGIKFKQYLFTSGTNYAPCNMFVMRRDLFDEWCQFIFPALFELKDRICGTEECKLRDNYQKRALCFLTERIFNFWCYMKKCNGLKIKEVEMVEHLGYKPTGVNERGDFS